MKPKDKARDRPDATDRHHNLARPLEQGEPFLPHEHDEAPGTQGSVTKGSRERIAQAKEDINRGLRDTDLHGTPSDVPGPHAGRENDPATEPATDDKKSPQHRPSAPADTRRR